MGTDILYIMQAKRDREWRDIPSDYQGYRHYNLFAHLAGVRNGYDFAGGITGGTLVCMMRISLTLEGIRYDRPNKHGPRNVSWQSPA